MPGKLVIVWLKLIKTTVYFQALIQGLVDPPIDFLFNTIYALC